MNERIRELSYEAQRYALNNTTGPDLAGLNELWQEKFAELIVKECVEVCHKMAEDSDSYVVHDGDTCAEQIKKHFGVEE